jgi:hypothetical protein
MAVLFVLISIFYVAITTRWLPSIRTFGLDIVNRIFSYATGLLGDKGLARRYMWILGGLMVVIFAGNIF